MSMSIRPAGGAYVDVQQFAIPQYVSTDEAMAWFLEVPAHQKIDTLNALLVKANQFCNDHPRVNRDDFLRAIHQHIAQKEIAQEANIAPPAQPKVEKHIPVTIQNPEVNVPIPQCAAVSLPNGALDYRPDGTYVPSATAHSCYPECHKFFEDFGRLNHPAFTLEEIRGFIQTLSPRQINLLAGNLSEDVMKHLQVGYTSTLSQIIPPTRDFPMPIHCFDVSKDDELHNVLKQHIADEITKALSSPETLVKGYRCIDSIPAYYVDIPMVTEEGNGLLQQIKGEIDGKYTQTIETLKDKERNPVTHVACRLMLAEHLVTSSIYLHFASELRINDKVINETSFG